MKKWYAVITCIFLIGCLPLQAEDGYRLWLRYNTIDDLRLLQEYRQQLTGLVLNPSTDILRSAAKELTTALEGLLGKKITTSQTITTGSIVVGTHAQFPILSDTALGEEGFIIRTTLYQQKKITLITANTDAGVLYGVFHFLRLLQTHQPINNLSISSRPHINHRLLNHWDNLNRTVERGYAGNSIWDWQRLPGYIDQRYIDYARANASIGINGTVLTNVNANAAVLTEPWLKKIRPIFEEATLAVPEKTFMQSGGKEGKHTEHLGYILTDLQYLQRTYPGAEW